MWNKIFVISTMLMTLIGCSTNDVKTDGILFPQSSLDRIVTQATNLSDIFEDYEIVPLETTEESIIGGRSTKIIKKDSLYFVKSINEIIIFNTHGKYIKKLSHIGAGPGEYDQLNDYDVVERYDEIWVSASKGIYRYDLNSLEYKGIISLPFIATQFKYLEDDNIIVRTVGQEIFKICSLEGEILKSFFPHDKANSGHPPFGFIKSDNKIVYHIENSNNVVCYDLSSDEFDVRNIIIPTDNLETMEINRDYYDRYGYFDQVDKVREAYIGISTFRNIGDVVMMTVRYPDGKWVLNITKGKECKAYVYAPQSKCELKNDIAVSASPIFYNTLLCGESDDSFIFYYNVENESDSNPYILDVKHVEL